MADITSLAVQKITKPNIEEILPYYLDGEALKSALDFIAYLRENKMKPSWTIHNAWKAVNKGKVLYYIRLPVYSSHFQRPNNPNWERSWCVTPFLMNLAKYENLITDEFDKKMVVDNLYGCKPYCQGARCSAKNPETRITICGTEIVRHCHSSMLRNRSLWVVNPDKNEIESIKKLLELEKKARADNRD